MCPPGYHHNGFVTTHALGYMIYMYVYLYMYMVFTTEGFLEVPIESCPEWDLYPQPLNSVQTF